MLLGLLSLITSQTFHFQNNFIIQKENRKEKKTETKRKTNEKEKESLNLERAQQHEEEKKPCDKAKQIKASSK